MAGLPDVQGMWHSDPDFEMNISGLQNDGTFNVKAVSASVMKHWQSGAGTIFESGKLTITFYNHNPNTGQTSEITVAGHLAGKQINFANGASDGAHSTAHEKARHEGGQW